MRFTALLLSSALVLAAAPAFAQSLTMDGPIQNQAGQQQQDLDMARTTSPQAVGADVEILPDEGESRGLVVTERQRPEYLPQGARVGSFRFLPEVAAEELFNDNIYATKNAKKSDSITIIKPKLALRSDWKNNALNFLVKSAHGIYADHNDENYNDYLLQADGRVDVTRNTRLAALASYSGNHEERGSPNDVGTQKDPVEFKVRTLQAEAFHRINRVKLDAIYSNQDFKYDDGQTTAGVKTDNAIRDRLDNEIVGRISYEATPTTDVFVQGTYINHDYNNRSNRDSQGYGLYGGLRGDITGKLFGDIYAGYIAQNYDSATYKDYSGFGFGMNGYWNITGMTTLTANLGREVQETRIPGAASYVETRAHLNLDHELRRNIILSLNGGYDRDEYQGINRDDDIWVFGGGVKYLVNHHFQLYANYNHIDRNSNLNGNDYTQNRILLGIKAAL